MLWLLGIIFLIAVCGVILGAIALSQNQKHHNHHHNTGFTGLTGLTGCTGSSSSSSWNAMNATPGNSIVLPLAGLPIMTSNTTLTRGATGPKGADGADGLNGRQGADGAPGANGADGAPGANGSDGVPGANGADGLMGPAGVPIYTEGNFTPILSFGGASDGITYNAQVGKFTQIGNIVKYSYRVVLTSKGTSVGNAQISGFTVPESSSMDGGMATSYCNNLTLDANFGSVVTLVNGSIASLFESATSGAGFSSLTNAHFSNTTTLEASGFYFSS